MDQPRLVGVDPGGDFLEHLRGDGFFDGGVLADGSGFGRLEERLHRGRILGQGLGQLALVGDGQLAGGAVEIDSQLIQARDWA